LVCSPILLPWLQSWIPSPTIQPLTPEGWFVEGHGTCGGACNPEGAWIPTMSKTNWYLWCPAPGAAECAVDQLLISRHKRPHLNHVFLCPRLLTHTWRKKLFKVADLVLELPAGLHPSWPASCHEPLILGLTLRFIHCSPWQLRGTPTILDLGRTVHRLWKAQDSNVRRILCKLCQLPDVLDGLS
jgi:hypothetical protein